MESANATFNEYYIVYKIADVCLLPRLALSFRQ